MEREVVHVARIDTMALARAVEALYRGELERELWEGGVNAWRRAGLPLRERRRRLPVDRQVQLIAGLMVLAGVGLGTLINPWFLVLAAFFGAGLTFAGATGTCGLAVVLMRMPWNRLPAGLPPVGGATGAARDAAPCAAPTNRDR